MSHIFISYSKKDIEFARHLRHMLQDHGFAVWMDETRLVPSEKWWPTIERNIISCAAFIVIMSSNGRDSEWIEREILVAEDEEHRKPIFPVLLEGKRWGRLANIQYQDMRQGIEATTLHAEFVEGLRQYAPDIGGKAPPPLPEPMIGTESVPLVTPRNRIRWLLIAVSIVLVIGASSIVTLLNQNIRVETPTVTQGMPTDDVTATIIAGVVATNTENAAQTQVALAATSTPSFTLTVTESPTLTFTTQPSELPLNVDTAIAATFTGEALQTVNAIASYTKTPTPTFTPTGTWTDTPDVQATVARGVEETRTANAIASYTKTPTPTYTFTAPNTPTPTSTFTSTFTVTPSNTPSVTHTPTSTFTPTFTATPTPTRDPLAKVTSNAEWKPYIRMEKFNGVEMILVPPGCFQMGSTDTQVQNAMDLMLEYGNVFHWKEADAKRFTENEQPLHRVCFEKSFWIDRYEVTNKQYGSDGYFVGDNKPHSGIVWADADAFCKSRNIRLPTEAEWEYAARGPDGLIYPWGNEFVAENIVDTDAEIPDVGSKNGGVSWVGAYDMGGYVWEYVSDFYGSYSATDQTNPQGPQSGSIGSHMVEVGGAHVIRGGASFLPIYNTRTAKRTGDGGGSTDSSNGFRCARDY